MRANACTFGFSKNSVKYMYFVLDNKKQDFDKGMTRFFKTNFGQTEVVKTDI